MAHRKAKTRQVRVFSFCPHSRTPLTRSLRSSREAARRRRSPLGAAPKTASSDDAVSAVSAVTITKEGAFLYNSEPVNEASLIDKLRAACAGNADVNLVISADELALHGQVVHVIDLAKVEGISRFAINVERSR